MSNKEKIPRLKSIRGARKDSNSADAKAPSEANSNTSGAAPKVSRRMKEESPAEPPAEYTAIPYQGMALIPLVKPAIEATPEPKFRGKQGKLALTVDLAIDAVAATDYVLRKYTKAGGITERLRRMGVKGDEYLAKRAKK
jgi:hypothetical protein